MYRVAFSLPPHGRARLTAEPPHPSSKRPATAPPPRFTRRAALPLLTTLALAPIAHADPIQLPKTEQQWRETLTPEQFFVLREHGTERPFSSPLNAEKTRGTFCCAACGARVFNSAAKFESGTGWPSFSSAIEEGIRVKQSIPDRFLLRKEVSCKRCGGHLGHVFEDGPRPTGLRYCINGVALSFFPA
ncbi:unnamed protein product [Agarophyton chilense]